MSWDSQQGERSLVHIELAPLETKTPPETELCVRDFSSSFHSHGNTPFLELMFLLMLFQLLPLSCYILCAFTSQSGIVKFKVKRYTYTQRRRKKERSGCRDVACWWRACLKSNPHRYKQSVKADDLAQEIRMFAALAEDVSSIPGTHTMAHNF